jgi:hypothetical protein
MAIEVLDPAPCTQHERYGQQTTTLEGIMLFEGGQPYPPIDQCLPVFTERVDIVVDDVSFKGAAGELQINPDPAYPTFNVWNGVEMFDFCADGSPREIQWAVRVTRSHFEHVDYGFNFGWLKGMSIQVGGSPVQANSFDTVAIGVSDAFTRSTTVDVAFNQMRRIYYDGYQVQAMGATEPSYHQFRHNLVEVAGTGNGVEVVDNPDLPTLSVEVTQNDIILNGLLQWGIFGFFSHDVLFANNRITGFGDLGVLVGDPWYEGDPWVTASGWVIKANNFNTAQFTWAPVVLGVTSADCTVVGGNNKTNVSDLGTNNILTGVNVGQKRMGQIISAKMRQSPPNRR